jgi:Fic family protein
MLCNAGVLREPLLYLSLYLKERRNTYYNLLDAVRREGDWERWLAFFIDGVRQTADSAVSTTEHLGTVFTEDRELIVGIGRRAGSALRVHDALKARPLASVQDVVARSGLSFPAVAASMDLLGELDIVSERTGRRRNRIFAYDRYLSILSEGTESPGALKSG